MIHDLTLEQKIEVAAEQIENSLELGLSDEKKQIRLILTQFAKTLVSDDNTGDSGLNLQRVTHRFITSIAEQYDIEPSKIVIGSQYGVLVVQKYDEGAADKWETLALIDPNDE